MWICNKCKEENEDNFDMCWNCQSDRGDAAIIENKDVEEQKVEDIKEPKVVHSSERPKSASAGFFTFRTMVSTAIVKVLYFLGMLALTIGGLVGLFSGDDEGVIFGLLALTVGNLLWRLMCEGWILLFSIHDILGSIENLLKRK